MDRRTTIRAISLLRCLCMGGLVFFAIGCNHNHDIVSPPSSGKMHASYTGIASWYGIGFHGRKTASGEVFNMYAYTAAHRTLPFGTKVKVTNLSNGKSVVVRINDRGPHVKNRIIDLSYQSAKKIGMIGPGTAKVRLEVLSRPRP